MLFDLQGKRRRLIQATYLTLAVLMGGGLVLFGVGSDVQGGLADIFSGGGSGGSASPAIEEQLEDAQERLEANPDDPEALADAARANYQLATATDAEAQAAGALFAADAEPRLEAAADAFERYLDVVEGKPDEGLAALLIQVYGEQGLNEPEMAVRAAEIVAAQSETAQAYLVLAQYAALAGNEQKARQAGDKAAALAPKAQRRQVEQQVEALIAAASAAQAPPAEGPGQLPLPGGAPAEPPGGGLGGSGSGGNPGEAPGGGG